MYQTAVKILQKVFNPNAIFKYGFNISPMYRRTTGKVIFVSEDLLTVKIEIPLNYKNKNYVGAIFGGSLFAATDPVFMIQLINILKNNYVVWDKAACVKYKAPAKEKVYASFIFTKEEIKIIKNRVSLENEINLHKNVNLTTKQGTIIAELDKTIYIASKEFYRKKLKARKNKKIIKMTK